MALSAMPPVQQQPLDDDDRDEVVPVSSWAKDGFAPVVPHAASQAHLIQYGPLTAQGNYLSQLDGQPLDWHAFAPSGSNDDNGHVGNLPSGVIFDTEQALRYNMLAAGQAVSNGPWPAMESVYDESEYPVYSHPPQIDSTIVHHLTPDEAFYDASSSAPLADFLPATSMAPQTLGPWEGIWAFNPNNVADNFVYPSSDAPPTSLAEPQQQSPTNGVGHFQPAAAEQRPDAVFVAPDKTEAPTHSVSQSAPSGPSPQSLSDPSRSPSEHSPSAVTNQSNGAQPLSEASRIVKSIRPDKPKRNRTMQVQLLVPRRQGPLSVEQRQKADDMRYYGACWRCRRYKKPCNGPGECDTCSTSGFRVWPSTIGCYRGNMEDFIGGVMPGNAELIMKDLQDYTKKPNWKVHFGFKPDLAPLPLLAGGEDRFTKLSVKLQATRMAGAGFIELLEVLANFQRTRTKPDVCLEHACEALSYICDVYHAFVSTDTSLALLPDELLVALTKFRSHYSANWRHFLNLCLSGRRNAWFPAFLCATINVPLLVVLKDGFVAIPEPARSSLWPNISMLIEDLRNRLYPMGLDLLSALSKGIKPWKLKCWNMVPCKDPVTNQPIEGRFERDPDGLRLLGGDIGAFDGFAAIQAWLARNREAMYHGVSFLTTPPFSERNAKMQPIAALAWIFDVAPPGQKVVNGRLVEDTGEEDDTAKA